MSRVSQSGLNPTRSKHSCASTIRSYTSRFTVVAESRMRKRAASAAASTREARH